MKQADLFTAPKKPVHWGKEPAKGRPNWERVAVCGVLYSVRDIDSAGPEGSSNLANVTCDDCLRKAGDGS